MLIQQISEFKKEFIESGAVQVMLDQPIEDPEEQAKVVHDIGIDICHRLYGINIPMMANYLKVQNIFISKVSDNLLKYMQLVGLQGEFISWTPAAYTVPILLDLARKGKDSKLKNFDPSMIWDPVHLDDPELTSPLNSFYHCNLVLKNIKNRSFLKCLYRHGIISKKEYNSNPDTLMLKLLPDNNFNKIMSIQKAIFKFY